MMFDKFRKIGLILICLLLLIQIVGSLVINKNEKIESSIEEKSTNYTVAEINDKLSDIGSVEICSITKENDRNRVILKIQNGKNKIDDILEELKALGRYEIENYIVKLDKTILNIEITLLI